ncbi:hypothetical protein DU002_06435 [Corallincola holothuriorum]|uniref:Periplasmic heavy metal sensor n=1 Tax=Corallincola holothuriorum TaxID=2282215 RepID=A0A368NKH9_9GAMM|nr:Spy/CpxP family protein refolding chaperone [Corallincola holothuriorum]RCU50958.1 hypothetical protein DU002_06435 [Corallincola holothuriorum]
MLKRNLLVLSLATALVAPIAMAKPGPGAGKNGMREVISQLDLSSEQQTQIKALFQAQKEQRKGQKSGQRQQMKADMEALITADSFDESKARSLIEQHSQRMEDRMVQRLQMQHQIYQLLTPEQQVQFLQLIEQQRDEKRAEKRGKGKS